MNYQKKLRRNDVVLVVLLLLAATVGLIYLFLFRDEGTVVNVTVDGKPYGTYSLSDNISHDIITGKASENFNSFVIENGKVFMKEASCPDGICVNHRPIFRDGESIVCLPNRVVITVVGEDDTDAPDIVA